jgi:hypothetical protein
VADPMIEAELRFENTIFLVEISDDVLLMTLHPAGNHGNQDVEDHSASQVGGRDEIIRPVYTKPEQLQ